MSDLTLNIELSNNQTIYSPGSRLTGRVTVSSPTGTWKAERVELVLFWRTSGIGDRDMGIGARMNLCDKGAELPRVFVRDFEFQVPHHPYTYHGSLIKIDWFIGLRIKKGWLSRQEIELPIEVRPAAVTA